MSGPVEPRESAQAIDIAASDWAVRHARGLSLEEAAEFDRWHGDRRHAGSFLRANALLCMASDREERADPAPLPAPPEMRNTQPTRRLVLGGGGAALAASVAGLFAYVQGRNHASSAIGEIRDLPLRDGSTAKLNTASSVRIDFSKRIRHVELVRGEAWFDVAHDAARPFVVRSGALNVRAIGTAFAVRRLADGVGVVTVTEGIVSVWLDGQEDRALRIAAGGRGIDANGHLSQDRIDAVEEDKQLAWRTGMIVLDGQTLDEAVADFNRYNRIRLVVADRALGRRRIYGTFRARDPQALAKAVSISFGTGIEPREDTILIRPL